MATGTISPGSPRRAPGTTRPARVAARAPGRLGSGGRIPGGRRARRLPGVAPLALGPDLLVGEHVGEHGAVGDPAEAVPALGHLLGDLEAAAPVADEATPDVHGCAGSQDTVEPASGDEGPLGHVPSLLRLPHARGALGRHRKGCRTAGRHRSPREVEAGGARPMMRSPTAGLNRGADKTPRPARERRPAPGPATPVPAATVPAADGSTDVAVRTGPVRGVPGPSSAPPRLTDERRLWREGYGLVAGVDEVGRGAWAGPLSVGVAVMEAGRRRIPARLRDSKQLAEEVREAIFEKVGAWCAGWAVGHVGPEECDALGMTEALRVATRRAFETLPDTLR